MSLLVMSSVFAFVVSVVTVVVIVPIIDELREIWGDDDD